MTKRNRKRKGEVLAMQAKPMDHFMRKMVHEMNQSNEIEGRKPIAANISILFEDGHIHHHFPEDKKDSESLYEDFAFATGFAPKEANVEVASAPLLPKQIVFHNRQAIGDILMFTCAVRDFKAAYPNVEVRVESTAMHLWDHNPHLVSSSFTNVVDPLVGVKKPSDSEKRELTHKAKEVAIKEGRPLKVYIGPGRLTNMSNRSDLHFANAYRMSMEDMLDIPPIKQGPIYPDIYMSEEEYKREPLVKPPYWLITAGEKGDWTAKTWPPTYFQLLVDLLPDLTFVQLGAKGHPHTELKGKNVVNFIGKTQDRNTGIRDLFNLFCNCEGSIGLVSFHMHLAAGFGKPCVVIAGAREPAHFTRFAGHQYLATDGCLPCTVTPDGNTKACWYCDKKRCPHLQDVEGHDTPLCVKMITPQIVANAVKEYYSGGRLDVSKPSGKSKLINVVKGMPTVPKPAIIQSTEELPEGFTWGGSNITDRDWEFIKNNIKMMGATRVLEFGAGLSTILLNRMGMEVLSFETNPKWADQIKKTCPDAHIEMWDGGKDPESKDIYGIIQNFLKGDEKFPLAFVDGPANGINREWSTRIASKTAKCVIVHDAGREWERKWQEKYIVNSFDGPIKGGHRCHSWVKTSKGKVNTEVKPLVSRGTVRVFFNGRGEGGAERSTTWIMNRLVELGWDVSYVPTNKNHTPSGTFRKEGNSSIRIGNLNACQEPVDVQLLYTNDWVWDFKLKEVALLMENAPAKRKVMAVNFRIGDIGKLEWTRNWDQYIFLNSQLEQAFRKNYNENDLLLPSIVLPPPTDLSVYFNNQPDYNANLRVVRHSSQGDTKYPKNFEAYVDDLLKARPDANVYLMPGPSWLPAWDKVNLHQRNVPIVPQFLGLGNCFWYVLPQGYFDQGPKVIMEAQASGLACIAPNHSGCADRIVHGVTGWLCDSREDYVQAYKEATPEELKRRGQDARQHAKTEYNPDLWIKAILGG
jgi:ADP-heptose:LPS heptosyltransferase/glycosyltransferase involved in cell wall biosynthesis